MANERGVIATSFTFDGNALSVRVGMDDVSLRQYLLYWDKIDYPDNNIIRTGLSPDMEFLNSIGILDRTKIQFGSFSGNPGVAMALMQAMALEIRNKQFPGSWALAQNSSKLFVPEETEIDTKTIEMELYSALPTPAGDTPLQDILEFKLRRQDELLNFRSAMDRLYLDVVNAADIPRAKNVALNRLEKTIIELNTVVNETWSKKLLSSLKVEINIPNLITHAVLGSGVAISLGLSGGAGAAIGAIAASFKFDLGISKGYKNLPNDIKDYAYLHRIEQEVKQ